MGVFLRPMLTLLILAMSHSTLVGTPQKLTVTCPYCGSHHASRNKLYNHYRAMAKCGNRAVHEDGLDIETKRPRGASKSALLFGYTSSSADAVDRLRNALCAMEGTAPEDLTLTCATDHGYRRSALLRSTYPALEDVAVYSSLATRDDEIDTGDAKSTWLARINAILADGVDGAAQVCVLDRQFLHKDYQRLNAEQACSARELVCVLPWEYLGEEPIDEAAAEATVARLKTVLRALLPPKNGTVGGYKHRRSAVQAAWKEDYRWHNFASSGTAVPTDASVQRVVDRFWVPGRPILSRDPETGRAFLRLHLSADGVLHGQLESMVGVAVCCYRGLLPPEFGRAALDPRVVLEMPRLPHELVYLRRARFDWESKKQPIFRSRKRGDASIGPRLADFEATIQAEIARSDAASPARCAEWLKTMEHDCCPRILRAAARQGLKLPGTKPDGPATRGSASGATAATSSDEDAAYAAVLRLLREADRGGKWPSTSRARARVLSVDDPSRGGSFSLRAPDASEGSSSATWRGRETRGNAEFEELTHAIFELERTIAPGRTPSTMVAVNRRATFLPHTDAGAGFGQSTSLIVGLGDYTGGELVVEGEPHDIRYAPLTFDGWRQRHWTLPFEGERFSLVWFTPQSAAEAESESECEATTLEARYSDATRVPPRTGSDSDMAD